MERAETIASPFGAEVAFAVVGRGEEERYAAPAVELACLSQQAVDSRRREFLRGRAAAHEALRALLGVEPSAVLKGASGEPLWPADTVGTISHTRERAVAAVARASDAAGLGVDLEPRDRRVDHGIARRVCRPAELGWVEEGGDGSRTLRLKQVFTAKEAVFKALYPLAQVYLGFQDAELRWDEHQGSFRARLLVDAAPGFAAGSELEVGSRVLEREVLAYLQLPPRGGER
jgi:4'-phosphopantetheinyl transferase EntD